MNCGEHLHALVWRGEVVRAKDLSLSKCDHITADGNLRSRNGMLVEFEGMYELVTQGPMAMGVVVVVVRAWMVVVGICVMLPVFGRSEYNCSMVPVPANMTDFFTFLRSTCQTLQQGTGKMPQHSMHATSINPKTNQTLEVWADCSLNQDETFCEQCLQILSANILTVCRNSSWADLNIENDCSIHYNASDYLSRPINKAQRLHNLDSTATTYMRMFTSLFFVTLLCFQ